MRVLFVISTLKAGGAERVMAVLSSYFAKNNDVSVVKFDNDDSFYEFDKRVKLLNLDYGNDDMGIVGNFKKRFGKIFALRKLIKSGSFDIVISFIDNSNILACLANFRLKTPLIISEHTNHLLLKPTLWKILRRLCYPLADGLCVLSGLDYEYYKFVKKRKIIYNPLWIDTVKINHSGKEKVILAVGRLIHLKGFDIFIKAISLVEKELLKGYKIYIAGDGKLRAELSTLAANYGVEIEFLGNRSDIINFYEKAEIFVLSSRMEGFPNVLIEALAFGCAVVSTNCKTGPSEVIVDRENGFLVEIDDAKMMAEKITTLIKNQNLVKEFSQSAIKSVQNLSVKKIAASWSEFIDEVIRSKR